MFIKDTGWSAKYCMKNFVKTIQFFNTDTETEIFWIHGFMVNVYVCCLMNAATFFKNRRRLKKVVAHATVIICVHTDI